MTSLTTMYTAPGRLAAGIGIAATLALASCATPTPYQPVEISHGEGGYSEVQLAPDRWRVTFAGNTLTSRETVEGYLLHRAAELTIERGYDWFEIVNRETEHEVRREIRPDPLYDPWWDYPYWRPYWRYYGSSAGWRYWYPHRGDPFWAHGIDMGTVERYEASAEIIMRHGQTPPGNGRIFDARDVIARIGPRIVRPT